MTPEGLCPSDKAAGRWEQIALGMTQRLTSFTWYSYCCILSTEIYNFAVEATSYARTTAIPLLAYLSLTDYLRECESCHVPRLTLRGTECLPSAA